MWPTYLSILLDLINMIWQKIKPIKWKSKIVLKQTTFDYNRLPHLKLDNLKKNWVFFRKFTIQIQVVAMAWSYSSIPWKFLKFHKNREQHIKRLWCILGCLLQSSSLTFLLLSITHPSYTSPVTDGKYL